MILNICLIFSDFQLQRYKTVSQLRCSGWGCARYYRALTHPATKMAALRAWFDCKVLQSLWNIDTINIEKSSENVGEGLVWLSELQKTPKRAWCDFWASENVDEGLVKLSELQKTPKRAQWNFLSFRKRRRGLGGTFWASENADEGLVELSELPKTLKKAWWNFRSFRKRRRGFGGSLSGA
jgi:hypothetical protein